MDLGTNPKSLNQKENIMRAMFDNLEDFAIFNAAPHLFSVSAPYQHCSNSANQPVFVSLISGKESEFKRRVSQFNGVTLVAH